MANVSDSIEITINDGMGEDEASNEVNFGIARWDNGQGPAVWINVGNDDGECGWVWTQQQWEQFKLLVDQCFNNPS